MAEEVNANGAPVKIRNPWGVVGLSIVTLGIYYWFWYYYLNRELRDYGRAMGDQELAESQPGMSVLAVTLGALIIVPAIVSVYRFITQRVQRAQELGGVEKVNGWIVLILILIISIAYPPYVQSTLNKLWERYGTGQAGIPAPAPTATVGEAPAQQPAPPAGETPPPPPPPQAPAG